MADDDEIDILGDFSFNSCFAQNNQGIPSCSDREDTVHPQWLLDSIATNWYDAENKANKRGREGPSRKLSGHTSKQKLPNESQTTWTHAERELLLREMAKYGRNVHKISQTIKTKTEAEIQALIEAEHGVNLETPLFGLDRHEDRDDVPSVVQEEIVAEDISNVNVLNVISTGSPTIIIPKRPYKKRVATKPGNSFLKPEVVAENNINELLSVNPSEILYEDDLVIGSTESIGSDIDSIEIVKRNMQKQHKEKIKAVKKIGNHRRKVSRNYDTGRRNKSKELLKSPTGRQRKDSSLSEDSTKSPKMQLVWGSGQALPVCEGEEIIKIEKKKDSDPESDIEIDVDSDNENTVCKKETKDIPKLPVKVAEEAPIAVPLRKFQPMPNRQTKINMRAADGGGGCTIMHTEAGDLYEVAPEPRKERAPRRQPVHLMRCRSYSAEKPAPFEVRLHVSTLLLMDCHAHTSHGEVMGLAGGRLDTALVLTAYRPAAAASAATHCDMEPVSQAAAAESLRASGLSVCAWHHSHPAFPASPSAQDLSSQREMQRALEWQSPMLAVITSQQWLPHTTASHFRCFRVEDYDEDPSSDVPTGYQFRVKLVPDLTAASLAPFLRELKAILRDESRRDELSVDMEKEVCPQAGVTYLEKCISSVSHHMRSAGYDDHNAVPGLLTQGIRDIFR